MGMVQHKGGVVIAANLSLVTGGCGGGGMSVGNAVQPGGSVTANPPFPVVPCSLSVIEGSAGYTYEKPFMSVGGTGGYPNLAGTGAKGGKGGLGSGGGGGGASTTGSGGSGGDGGDGYVCIVCW